MAILLYVDFLSGLKWVSFCTAQYRKSCTIQPFEQFVALYMHTNRFDRDSKQASELRDTLCRADWAIINVIIRVPITHKTWTHCWHNAGPPSTSTQHYASTGSMSRFDRYCSSLLWMFVMFWHSPHSPGVGGGVIPLTVHARGGGGCSQWGHCILHWSIVGLKLAQRRRHYANINPCRAGIDFRRQNTLFVRFCA